MKKFIYQKQSHFTADGDHFKANNRTLADFVKSYKLSPKNNRLLIAQNADNLESTTKLNSVNRKRYISGIFLPQIYQINGNTKPLIYSELAVRATPRNKAETIRTNKGGGYLLSTVVEPLSHPFGDKPLSLTRKLNTMNKPTQTINGIIAKLTTFPFVLSAEKGACYA